jgi:hypothetical protein
MASNGQVTGTPLTVLVVDRMAYPDGDPPFDCVQVHVGESFVLSDGPGGGGLTISSEYPIYIPLSALPACIADMVRTLDHTSAQDVSESDMARISMEVQGQVLAEALVHEAEARVAAERLIKRIDDLGWVGVPVPEMIQNLASENVWREAVAHAANVEARNVPAIYDQSVARAMSRWAAPGTDIPTPEGGILIMREPEPDDSPF